MTKRSYIILATLSSLVLLGLWIGVSSSGLVRPIILPSPQSVLDSLVTMVLKGYSGVSLSDHFMASMTRVGIAFVGGSIIGIAIGLMRARSPAMDAVFLVPGEMLRPIPPLGLIPLFILWFGIGEASKILLIGLSVLLIMMVNSQAGARSVQTDLMRAAQTCGANQMQIFRHVIFPAALPQIMTGLRVALGTALSILVASELLGGDRGLGFVVLDAANFFRTSHVFAGVILIGAIGLISDRCLAFIARRIVHWEGRR
ncbi:MAG: taurine transport system permease protein [Thauera sp.]|nr:ABC transporter permease [Thauera sp.]MDI3491363.1 taurine transport system permease protein [Thauera sp.]